MVWYPIIKVNHKLDKTLFTETGLKDSIKSFETSTRASENLAADDI